MAGCRFQGGSLMADKQNEQTNLHLLAAKQLELAAEHNRLAAEFYERGNVDKARYHAFVAEGHYLDAGPLAERLSGLSTTLMLLGARSKDEVRARRR
jgi:hypothetical protein